MVRESPILSEPPLRALIQRLGIHPLGDSRHGHLSGQPKALAELVVDQLVERQLSGGLVMPRLLATPIAGPIRSLQATAQSVRVGTFELDCDPQSHNSNEACSSPSHSSGRYSKGPEFNPYRSRIFSTRARKVRLASLSR